MKKVLVVVISLVLLAAAFGAGLLLGARRGATFTSDIKQLRPLALGLETERVKKLGIDFPDEGNAGDIYIDYVDPEKPFRNDETRAWLDDSNRYKSEDPKDQAKVSAAVEAAGPHLDRMIKAGRMKECKLWGTHLKPDPQVRYFEQPFPDYFVLVNLGRLLIARGNRLAAAGDVDQAREQYLTLIRMGAQLEQEPVIVGHLVAVALKRFGAEALADFHQARGETEEETKWRLYYDIEDIRNHSYSTYTVSAPTWDRDLTEIFITDPDVPYAYKLETVAMKHFCGDSFSTGNQVGLYQCIAFGPPEWVDSMVDQFGAQDDLSAQFAKTIKNHDITFKDLQMVGVIR